MTVSAFFTTWLPQRREWRRLRDATRTLRRIIGAPDYEAYVAHRRRFHPHCEIMSEAEFTTQRLEDRYARPGSRCC